MTSSLIDDISDELLACRICLEPLRRPKTLPCRHTFCELCLERLRDCSDDHDDDVGRRTSSATRRSPVRLTCPVCYESCPLPPGGVRRLPDDPIVTQLYSVIERRRPAVARTLQTTCQICSKATGSVGDGRRPVQRSAHVKCVECNRSMCSSCARFHRRTNVRILFRCIPVADLERGRAGSAPPPFGRRTDAVAILLISDNGNVLWRCHR